MVNKIDLENIKDSFASLLCGYHQIGLNNEMISDIVLHNSFFDCFENNDLNDLSNLSIETIIRKTVKIECNIDYDNFASQIYWCGLVYMNLLFNYSIPLRKSILLFPINKLITLFPKYHEMNDVRICQLLVNEISKFNILKTIRKETNISLRQLSFLTGIKERTLMDYETSNSSYKFNNEFVDKLCKIFEISEEVFNEKSRFIPLDYFLFENEDFVKLLKQKILKYFNYENNEDYQIIDKYMEQKDLKSLLKENKKVISLYSPYGIVSIVSNRINYRIIPDQIYKIILKQTIEELTSSIEDNLIF